MNDTLSEYFLNEAPRENDFSRDTRPHFSSLHLLGTAYAAYPV